MTEIEEQTPQQGATRGKLVVLYRDYPRARPAPPVHAGLVAQLLSIRDNHPQWRRLRREDGVIAAHAYAVQLKDFTAPNTDLIKL